MFSPPLDLPFTAYGKALKACDRLRGYIQHPGRCREASSASRSAAAMIVEAPAQAGVIAIRLALAQPHTSKYTNEQKR
jgi:hypothetical protein